MKKLIKTFFLEDTVSAVFALIIFVCYMVMFVSHIFHGLLSTGAFFLELLLGVGVYGLLWAVYSENKKDAEYKKHVK